jgi:Fe-S cluster biogenesis protein NfuA
MSSISKAAPICYNYLSIFRKRRLMENIEKDVQKIKQIIEELKPKYTAHGGDIEFVDIKDQDVRIRPTGYCWR